MSDTSIDVNGEEVKVHVVRGDSRPTEALMAMLATGRIAHDRDDVSSPGWSIAEKASNQLATSDTFAVLDGSNAIAQPTVRPEYCTQLYRAGGMHRSCIDTKVSDSVGLGWRIRPRAELFPRAMDLSPGAKQPNAKEQEKIEAFLDLGMENGNMESFTDINCQMMLDYECAGQGYVEFSRDDSGKVNGIYSVKGETFRIAALGPKEGFWQSRNGRWRYFAPYTGKNGVKIARIGSRVEKAGDQSFLVPTSWSFETFDGSNAPLRKDFVEKADDAADVVRANEILMFKQQTPKDTHYGEPAIVSGIEDYLIAQGVRLFIMNYFDSGAVPRLILYVSGDAELTDETLDQLKVLLETKGSINALNAMPCLRLPEGTSIDKLVMTDAHLTDSSSMLSLRDRSELYVAMVHRVPLSAIPAILGEQTVNRATADEANRRYVSSVIRPRQRYVEERWNYVFRKELGIKDWVIDFEIPDLLDMKTKYEIWQIGVTNGWLSVNDVRSQLNMRPVPGGEEPALRIAGQGIIPLSEVQKIRAGARPKDIMATGDTKTLETAKAILPDSGNPIKAYIVPTAEWPDMPADERAIVEKAIEELVVNPDDVPSSA